MVNPLEFVGGAALGTALSVLVAGLDDLIRKNHAFVSHFRKIHSRLQPLQSAFEKISAINPDELKGLEKVLTDGKVLVDKCKKVSWWSLIKRYRYYYKLVGWEEELVKQLPVVQLQGVLDGKMTGLRVQAMEDATNKIKVSTERTEVTALKLDAMVENVTVEVKEVKISTKTTEVSVANLTEEVKNMKVEINQTIKENLGIQDEFVVFKNWSAVPELPLHQVGLDGPLNELKEKLLKDNGLSKLVLTGPGGCGKTTLVSKFCRDKEVKDKFRDNIFFVTISKVPKMDLIVEQLYQQKGKKAPVFSNEENAAIFLPKYLMEKGKSPLLIVLDDVWSGSEVLLAMFDLTMTDYKVLITSRSELKGFGPAHKVQLLDPEKAMELFLHSTSIPLESLDSEDTARKIVKHCCGFPLALIVVGKSLSGKPEAVWITLVQEWSTGR